MRHIADDERRHRLARRHKIAPGQRLGDPVEAARAMTVLHATDQVTVHLSLVARVDELTNERIENVLFDDRTLVKQLAMRRTLFMFPRDLLPAALGSAAARVAERERKRLVKDMVGAGVTSGGDAWLEDAATSVLDALTEGPLSTAQVRERVPQVAGSITVAPGTKWSADVAVAARVLTVLSAQGRVVRGSYEGTWRSPRPTWVLMADWLGHEVVPLTAAEGYAELVRRWLWTFGPGTVHDLAWWLGSTLTAARGALSDAGAVEVSLDGGQTGWVHPEDLDPLGPPEPWAALLPILDPTVMGWKTRGFYLGDDAPQLFDSVGNAGTTAWWNGRVVGCWVQDAGGTVVVVPLRKLARPARAALETEAARLTEFLQGVRVGTTYPSPLMRGYLDRS